MDAYQEKNKQDLIEYSNLMLITDIGNFLKPYKWRFFFASLFRFASDIANLYPAYGLALVVTFFSRYNVGDSLHDFWIIVAILIVTNIVGNSLRFLAKIIGYKISEKVALDSQIAMIKHFSLLDISWHEKDNAGNKLKRIQKGSDGIDGIMRIWINNFIEIAINFIGMLFILTRIDNKIGVIMIVFLITYLSISIILLRRAVAVSQEVDIMEEGISGLMYQAINNIRSVKVLAMADRILKMVKAQTAEIYVKIVQRIFRFQSRGTILNLWAFFFRVGMMIFIAIGISQGRFEVGLLVLFNGYFGRLTESVEELSSVAQDIVVYKYGVGRMCRTLREPILIDNDKDKVNLPKDWKKISIKNLSFAYGKNQVLKNISFVLKRGERVGIVGLSGAGKSTLFKLLLKENENYTGEILVDGIPLKKIKKKSYLSSVGVVLQDTEVFNFTLRDNITIASSKKLSRQKFQDALDIAHVADFASKLPAGIDTFIGEKGIKLSGGERQRLGIARAVYKQPEILFLDEATSHLDLESEEKIKDSLHKFFQKVTAVVIAHRLTTIREMDKIIVIEKGEIVEIGGFEELYNSKGRLFEFWEKQKF